MATSKRSWPAIPHIISIDWHLSQILTPMRDAVTRLVEAFTLHDSGADPHTQYLKISTAVKVFAFVGYGGMKIAAPPVIPSWDISGAWQTLDFFDLVTPDTPRGITVNIANNSVSYDNAGLYMLAVTGTFEHDEAQAGRVTYVRMYNATDGVALPGLSAIGVGRNNFASSINIMAMVEVDESLVDKEIQVQIGGGDDITVDDFLNTAAVTWNIGEWRGTL